MAAGRATLELLREEDPYPELERLGRRLQDGLAGAAGKSGVALECANLGSMFTAFFRTGPVLRLSDAKECDTDAHAAFFRAMLKRGVYLPPSQFETAFISAAHEDSHIDAFVSAAEDALNG